MGLAGAALRAIKPVTGASYAGGKHAGLQAGREAISRSTGRMSAREISRWRGVVKRVVATVCSPVALEKLLDLGGPVLHLSRSPKGLCSVVGKKTANSHWLRFERRS